jgi:hypothetical protein
VGVDNTDGRIFEYTYSVDPTVGQGGGADLYLDFLEQTVLPLVQTLFRVQAPPAAQPNVGGARWGILGSSLGGLLSCYAGWTRPMVYGLAGCMSSSFWWNDEDFNSTVLPSGAGGPAPYPPVIEFYLDSGNAGTDDDDVNQTLTVRNSMHALGFPYGPTAGGANASLLAGGTAAAAARRAASANAQAAGLVRGPSRADGQAKAAGLNASPVAERLLGYYLDEGGQHGEAWWGQRFWVPMTFAYPPAVALATPV